MKKWYMNLSTGKKQTVWLCVVAIVGLIATAPLFFVDIPSNYSYFFGWLLGSIAELIGFASILYMGRAMEESSKNGGSKSGAFAALTGTFRFIFYAAVLVIAAICTFKSQWFGGFDAFNFWTCFGALMPLQIVLIIFHLTSKSVKQEDHLGDSK